MDRFTQNKNIMAVFVIIAVSLVNAGSTLYLPAMLNIQHDFHTTNWLMRLTLSSYLIAFALSQFLHGPLSDAYGRRVNLIMGCIIFIAGGFVSLFSTNIAVFTTGRLIEGFGIGTANASGYALMRDLFQDKELAKRLSYISISVSITAIIAPVIGGYLTQYLGWRTCFGTLILISTLLAATKFFYLPETNRNPDKTAHHPKRVMHGLRQLLKNPTFMGYSLISALTYSMMMVPNSMLPFLLRHLEHNYKASDYGWIITIIGLGYLIGAIIGGRLVKRYSIMRTVSIGVCITLLTQLCINTSLGLNLFDHSVLALMITLATTLVGAGMTSPIAFGGAMTPFPHMAGQAAAVGGAIMFAIAAICTAIGAKLSDHTPTPLFALMLAISLITQVMLQWLRIYTKMRRAQ